VLKGSFKSSSGAVWLRKTLVVVQFTISVVLIVGILVVSSQLSYIRHKDLGYKKDALVALKVNGNNDVIKGFAAFKNELLSDHLIAGVTTSNSLPVGGLGNGGATTITGDGKPVVSSIYSLRIENNFIDVYGMKLLAGRNFSANADADSNSYILNEAAVRSFGWGSPEKAISKPFARGDRKGQVIGIVKDFHFNSLQHPVEPLAILVRYGSGGRFSQITVKADMAKPKESIAWIEQTWKKYFPGALLQYDFIDKKLNDQYQAEDRFAKFFFYFSILSLLIACLGLFGLTAYATQQRTKEIGIRKVLGASIPGIAGLLSKDFLKLVVVAFVIAVPIAWYAMYNWLQDFAYRITISWWVFAVAGIAAFVIAFLTISFQAVKAAMANPVQSLRTE
jgi:putative ABC transport system permease protein